MNDMNGIEPKLYTNKYTNGSVFGIFGIMTIDIINYIKTNYNLDSYKLDYVGKHFLGECKVDLKPKEIFEKFKGTANDRLKIGIYCIQDCLLCSKLIQKLKIV